MTFLPPSWFPLVAAAAAPPPGADSSGTRTAWEFGREGWQIYAACFAALILVVGWIYRRDTSELNWFWKLWLFGLRGAVIAGLLIIALDPEERTETKTT